MLIQALAKFVDPVVRQRGRNYSDQGRVLNLKISEGEITARVRGSTEYGVSIDILRGGDGTWDFDAHCSCPYPIQYDDCCKHIWATLLDAERRGLGVLGPLPARIRLLNCQSDEDPAPVIVKGAEKIPSTSGSLSPAGARPRTTAITFPTARGPAGSAPKRADKKPKKPRPPEWMRLLDQAPTGYYPARRAGATEPIGEVLYVLDADRTRERDVLTIALFRAPAEIPPRSGGLPVLQVPARSGGPPKLKKLGLVPSDVPRLTNPSDRVICGMLVGAGRPGREWAYADTYEGQASTLWQIDRRMTHVLLPLLLETGRFLWRDMEGDTPQPVAWEADPWEVALVIDPAPGPTGFAVGGSLRRSRIGGFDERLPLTAADLMLKGEPGLLLHGGVLSPLRLHGCEHWLLWLRSSGPAAVSREELPGLIATLGSRGLTLPVCWPESWGVSRVTDVMPRGRVTLVASRDRYHANPPTEVRLSFEYGSAMAAEGEGGAYIQDASGAPGENADGSASPGAMILRNPDAERGLAGRLDELGAKSSPYSRAREIASKRAIALVTTLLHQGWTVMGEKGAYKRPSGGAPKITVSSGIDWFDVRGEVDFDGATATLPDILGAVQRGEEFVTLGDGSLGMLPEEWLSRHARWLGLGRAEDGAVRFGRAQVGLIDAMLAEMPESTCDEQVAAARRRLAEFQGVRERRETPDFRGQLRPYQREGLGWLHFLAEFGFGGCLADDMGLGKTVQLLAHIADQRSRAADSPLPLPPVLPRKVSRGSASDGGGVPLVGRASRPSPSKPSRTAAPANGTPDLRPWLVVAPKTLIFNWAREAERFTPHLKILDYTGLVRRTRAEEIAKADLVLTTYGTLRRDAASLREIEFECVVLDEAQAIKNADSQGAKAARLLKARRRLALTGTPVENRLDDLWSLFEFLNPGMLGGAAAFRAALSIGKTAFANGEAQRDDAGFALLRRALRPFILRRTKEKVAPELPRRSEQTITCELGPEQRALYDQLRLYYRAQVLGKVESLGMARAKVHVLEALLRLRQAACHPALIGPHPGASGPKATPVVVVKKTAGRKPAGEPGTSPEYGSAKVEMLLEMVRELLEEGHKALVFSQFTSFLSLVREQFDARNVTYEYLDGKTPAAERARRVDRFQSDEGCRLFLISLKAGGVGLNLTAADYVFLLDPWWNPAVEAQAIDRTHRIGQEKKVFAYRLIARDTVEERILELQRTKRELAEAIIADSGGAGAAGGPLSSMTREDLEWLLS